jgi:hypothetical protein
MGFQNLVDYPSLKDPIALNNLRLSFVVDGHLKPTLSGFQHAHLVTGIDNRGIELPTLNICCGEYQSYATVRTFCQKPTAVFS